MSDEPTAQKLRIHHLKAPDFTTKRSDGVLVLNALNGDGVQFTFYIERTPIPLYIDVIPGTGEVVGWEGKEGIVREIQTSMILDKAAARALRDRLSAMLDKKE